MDEPIVAVEGLVKRYGDVVAVNDISFQIQEGEIFGLLGPPGVVAQPAFSLSPGRWEAQQLPPSSPFWEYHSPRLIFPRPFTPQI